MDAFIKNLSEAINLPEDINLAADSRLKDLPTWDSLAILTTISMLDMEYGIMMTGAEIQSCGTVADLHGKVMDATTGA